jgi:hypothetical protein
MRTLKASLVYFALVFAAGFVLGSVRVPFLVPRLGERFAELLEMPVMLVVIVAAARYVVRRDTSVARPTRLLMGVLALAFVVAAELLLAFATSGASPLAYLASRDPVSGTVYLVLLVVFAVLPAFLPQRAAQR